MSHLEFVVLLILLLRIIFRRLPVPWRADMFHRITLAKLNRIEAAVRNMPLEEVEREFAKEFEKVVTHERATPWYARNEWKYLPLDKTIRGQ